MAQAAKAQDLPSSLTLYTKREVAEILRRGSGTVEDLLRSKELRGIRIGGEVRISKEALLAYLEANPYDGPMRIGAAARPKNKRGGSK